MASQRKARLSDIRAPAGSRPIESRGFVRLPRERIRQSGFQPSRELFNFRALSRTLEQAGRVGAQLHADIQNEEQAEEFEKLNTAVKDAHEVEEDLTSEGGEIRFLNEFPMPGREGEEIVIRPGLGHAPDTISPHLREVSKEIGEATRAGILSSDVSPTLGRATGKNLGRAAAQVYLETLLHDDIGPLSRGNWENGKFVPEVDRDLRFRERYTQLLEANPALSVNSDNPDMSAILEFQRQVKDYKRQISLKVKAARSDQARKMAANSAVMSIQATMSSALDMTTGLDGVPNFAEIQDGEDAAAVDSISETLSGMHAAGLTGDEVDSVFIQAVMGKARAIDAEYADRPYEAEMQLSHLASMVENVPMGGTGVAADHPKFAETALAIDAMINKHSRGGSSGGVGNRSRFTSLIGESPFLLKAFEALEAEDAVSLEKAKDDHMEWSKQQVDIKGLIGSDRRKALQEARELWKNQGEPFGYKTTREAQADFAIQSVMAIAHNGDPEGARERLNTLYSEGVIKTSEKEFGHEEISKVTTVHDKVMRIPVFQAATRSLDKLAKRLEGMGLSEADVGPILENYRDSSASILAQANDIFIDAEDGPAAIRESMERGALSADFELAAKGLRTRIEDFDSTMSELDKRLAEGHAPSAEEQKRFVGRGGHGAQKKIAAIRRATEDGTLFRIDPGTSISWESLNRKLSEEVATFMATKTKNDSFDPNGILQRRMEAKMKSTLLDFALLDNQEQRSTSDPNWRASLKKKWEESFDKTIGSINQTYTNLKPENEMAMQASNAEEGLARRAKNVASMTKDDFERVFEAALVGPESELTPALKRLLTGRAKGSNPRHSKAYSRLIADRRYSTSKRRVVFTPTRVINLPTVEQEWEIAHKAAIEDIEAKKDLTPEGRNQLKGEFLLFTGQIKMTDLEKGDRYVDPKSKAVVDLNTMKINPYLGALFNTRKELYEFVGNADRVAKMAERLGQKPWDPSKDARMDPTWQHFRSLQDKLIMERNPRGQKDFLFRTVLDRAASEVTGR